MYALNLTISICIPLALGYALLYCLFGRYYMPFKSKISYLLWFGLWIADDLDALHWTNENTLHYLYNKHALISAVYHHGTTEIKV